jgi:pyruvate formate lyase activating enzyme
MLSVFVPSVSVNILKRSVRKSKRFTTTAGEDTVSPTTHPVRSMAFPAICACMNAGYLKARQAFAAFDVQKTGVFGAAGLTKETFHTTTIPCRQTASVTLCAPVEPAAGIPKYAVKKGPEHGHNNLAVFYHACAFNCLYCQNYHFKTRTSSSKKISAGELANAVDKNTTCICYFGGDPTPQILHAIKTSKIAINEAKNRVLRICWETNGAMRSPYLNMIAELSLRSGGCIKIDLKAWNKGIHQALCGVTNAKTIENFRTLAELTKKRPEPPLLIASTLLVPGYVDEPEVVEIARFISDLSPDIPYSLLAFYPQFYLNDLPTTSKSHALRCKAAAENAGLRRVHIGNLHLLRN